MSQGLLTLSAGERLWQRFRDSLPPAAICVLAAFVGLLIPALLLRFPMVLTIAGVAAMLGLALVVGCPYIGLLIFLGLLYLRPEEFFPALAGARMTLLVSLAAFFAWLINTLLCRGRFHLNLPSVQCFLAFVLVVVGSTALSDSGAFTEEALEMLKLLILFVLVVHLVNTEARLRVALSALVLFSAWLGARTIWQYQHGQALVQSDGEVRAIATGIFGDPNDLSLAMAMALPLALGAGLGTGSAWMRMWNLAAVPILIWTVFVTNSRGGMLALAAGMFFFFGRRVGRVGIILGGVAALLLFSFGPSRLTQMSAEEESAQGRVVAWTAGLEMVQRSPLWGVGKGMFVEYHRLTAHNSLVLCLAETGLLGTGFWLGMFYFAIRNTQRVPFISQAAHAAEYAGGSDQAKRAGRCQSSLLQISLVTFMVGGFFLSRTYTPPLYVYLGLAVAAAQVEAEGCTLSLPGSTGRDWRNIAAIVVGGLLLIMFLVKMWS